MIYLSNREHIQRRFNVTTKIRSCLGPYLPQYVSGFVLGSLKKQKTTVKFGKIVTTRIYRDSCHVFDEVES